MFQSTIFQSCRDGIETKLETKFRIVTLMVRFSGGSWSFYY